MLTVYAIPPSLYCAKLRITLRAKGVAWREVLPPGGYGSADYKALVPSGNLPAVQVDGLLLADSEAIAEYLNEVYPSPAMLPDTAAGRARMRERGRFHDTRLEPALRALFGSIKAPDAALSAAQSGAISERLAQLGRMLGADDLAFGLGDCGYPITFAWIDALTPVLGLQIDWPQAVRAYRARVEAVGPVAAELQSYVPVLQAWLAEARG
ncbi:glutathione S-transferase family protein [Pseudorhodobacter sp. E13]|uniref:glutathione S-transferase family protein n=1 Tax=Pseudorhodobacter sp. E13 TaxID=2487931 RepID=UPI000F8C4CC1|nr:glutathione S-transferase family protein [Pseudorhodobacter sp. E13]RUS59389.1 glutathione S-transferase family protein [Pseudorhodobacter sp. E13]